MSSSTTMKTVRLPSFSGNSKDFQVWWMRFTAFATVWGFSQSVKRNTDPNLPATEDTVIADETQGPGKLQSEARKSNAVAMANLTMAFGTEALMGLIEKSKSREWPNGLACRVVERMFQKYQPEDTISKVEMRQELSKVRMKKEEDPSNMFETLLGIQNRYRTATYTVPEEELIAVVLDQAPKEYGSVLTLEQRTQGTNLELQHLEEIMRIQWRVMYNTGTTSGKEDSELSLISQDGPTCYRCKKKGHKAFECPDGKSQDGKKRFTGKCNTCGKKGHKAATCWGDPKNANKVPEWFKKKNNNGGGNEGGDESNLVSAEVMLCQVTEDINSEEEKSGSEITLAAMEFPRLRHY